MQLFEENSFPFQGELPGELGLERGSSEVVDVSAQARGSLRRMWRSSRAPQERRPLKPFKLRLKEEVLFLFLLSF